MICRPVTWLFWQPHSVASFLGGITLLPSTEGSYSKYKHILFLMLIAREWVACKVGSFEGVG